MKAPVAAEKGAKAASAGKSYAVLFATDDYAHFAHLPNPISDATELQLVLHETYGVETELVPNPTVADILTTLRRYIDRKYVEGSQVTIFLAGHGYFDDGLKVGYLAARDSDQPESDPAHRSGLSFDDLQRYVERVPATHVLLLIDSCYSGTIDRRLAESGPRIEALGSRSTVDVIRDQSRYPTRRFIASAGKTLASDGVPGQHSPFTFALLNTLKENAVKQGYTRWRDLQAGVEKLDPPPRWGSFGNDDPNGDMVLLTAPMREKMVQDTGSATPPLQ